MKDPKIGFLLKLPILQSYKAALLPLWEEKRKLSTLVKPEMYKEVHFVRFVAELPQFCGKWSNKGLDLTGEEFCPGKKVKDNGSITAELCLRSQKNFDNWVESLSANQRGQYLGRVKRFLNWMREAVPNLPKVQFPAPRLKTIEVPPLIAAWHGFELQSSSRQTLKRRLFKALGFWRYCEFHRGDSDVSAPKNLEAIEWMRSLKGRIPEGLNNPLACTLTARLLCDPVPLVRAYLEAKEVNHSRDCLLKERSDIRRFFFSLRQLGLTCVEPQTLGAHLDSEEWYPSSMLRSEERAITDLPLLACYAQGQRLGSGVTEYFWYVAKAHGIDATTDLPKRPEEAFSLESPRLQPGSLSEKAIAQADSYLRRFLSQRAEVRSQDRSTEAQKQLKQFFEWVKQVAVASDGRSELFIAEKRFSRLLPVMRSFLEPLIPGTAQWRKAAVVLLFLRDLSVPRVKRLPTLREEGEASLLLQTGGWDKAKKEWEDKGPLAQTLTMRLCFNARALIKRFRGNCQNLPYEVEVEPAVTLVTEFFRWLLCEKMGQKPGWLN